MFDGKEHEQLSDQGAVYDKAIIAFDVAGVSFVIVDAVPIQRQCGIAKEQGAVEIDVPQAGFSVWCVWWRHVCLGGVLSINQILPFGQGEAVALFDVVADADKSERTTAPGFVADGLYRADLFGAYTCQKGAVENELSGRPHAPWQADIGYEATRGRVTVTAQSFWRLRIPKVEVVKEGRQRIATFQPVCHAQGSEEGIRAGEIKSILKRLRFDGCI